METNEKFDLPLEIQTFLSSNVTNFVSCIYLKTENVDFSNYLNDLLFMDSTNSVFHFNYKKLVEINQKTLFQFNIKKVFSDKKKDPKEGFFFLIEDNLNKVYFAISPENKDFFNKVINPFIQEYFYDKISKVFITSKEIYNILARLEIILQNKVMTNWCTGKRVFQENPDTISKWTDKKVTFQQCFSKANQEKMSINWIRISSYDLKYKRDVKMDISRDACISGNFHNITEIYNILNIIISKGKKDFKILNDKQITKNSPAIPIVLDYQTDILVNKELKEKLIGTINKYKNCTYSVIHGGNPHIYMYVRDSIDSSSFSLRTLGPGKILLIPQLKATYSSLIRFIHFLNENFTEYKELYEIRN